MKKNIRILSATFLTITLIFTVFTACKSKTENDISSTTLSTQNTQPVSSIIHATDYTYNDSVIATSKSETKHVYTLPPLPSSEDKTEMKTDKNSPTNVISETTPNQKPTNEKIEEVSKELSLITKTSPVAKGNSATVIIQGTPGAQYTIEFYKNNTTKAEYNGLDAIKADSSGFASWTFTVENDCETGDRKIIIREKNSNKFIQTSITVQ